MIFQLGRKIGQYEDGRRQMQIALQLQNQVSTVNRVTLQLKTDQKETVKPRSSQPGPTETSTEGCQKESILRKEKNGQLQCPNMISHFGSMSPSQMSPFWLVFMQWIYMGLEATHARI